MRLASNRALHFIGAVSGAREDAPEDITGSAQETSGRAGERRLEPRHESVTAFVAEELKLVTTISRQVFVIRGEFYHCHTKVYATSLGINGTKRFSTQSVENPVENRPIPSATF